MPFIDMNLGEDVQEKNCAPEGEYDLVVSDMTMKDKTYDNDVEGHYLNLRIEIENADEEYKAFFHILSLPNAGDDKDGVFNKTIAIKRFCALADIPTDDGGFNTEDLQGARFNAKLTIEIDDDGEYPDKNRLTVPFLDAG